jgi:GGDEF domain-containing protein
MTQAAPGATLDEAARQRALDRYRILDTLPEGAYDDIVRVASTVCDTPVALVSLLDRDRQWFKARTGLDAAQTPRNVAVCDHAIREPHRLMEIPDLSADARFADFPAVTGELGARFYAGMPLVTPEGAPVGTVCVIDSAPRTLTEAQRDALAALARITVAMMESGQREHAAAASVALHATPTAPVAPASATNFIVAILELQDYAGTVQRLGERTANRALEELDHVFEQCLRGGQDVLNRVTGSVEWIAVLHQPGADDTLQRLREEAARQLASTGLDVHVGAAPSQQPGEKPEMVYLRADEALSAAKSGRGG